MNNSMTKRNSLFEAKIFFLIFSFILGVIAISVQNEIWPFLQESLPPANSQRTWFISASIIGLILPSCWLLVDWQVKTLRFILLSIIMMQLLQILTELAVSRYFFISMVVPTAILYVGYRLIQFLTLHKLLLKIPYKRYLSKKIRYLIVAMNILFWGIVWVKLTFVIFPQIIN